MSEQAPKNSVIDQIDRNQVTEEAPYAEARIMRATETLKSNLSEIMKYRNTADNKVSQVKHVTDVVEQDKIPYRTSINSSTHEPKQRTQYRVVYDEWRRTNEDESIIVTQRHADFIPVHGDAKNSETTDHEIEVRNVDGSYVRYFVPGDDMYDEEPKMASYIAYDQDGMPELDDEGLAVQSEMSFDQIKELNELVFALQ